MRNNGKNRSSSHETMVTSVLGADCTVHGDVRCTGTIRVDGVVEGTVEAEDTIIIGHDAKVTASLHANQIIIGGEVHGDVTADDRVEIQATGSLHGDLRAPKLSISEGVIFEGRSLMDSADRAEPSAREPGDVETSEEPVIAYAEET
jgi:cytoskeletal protein CcmA (bactofilin family)